MNDRARGCERQFQCDQESLRRVSKDTRREYAALPRLLPNIVRETKSSRSALTCAYLRKSAQITVRSGSAVRSLLGRVQLEEACGVPKLCSHRVIIWIC